MKRIGVIAEDKSDVEVVDEIIRKYGTIQFKILEHVGRGCGRISAKALQWSQILRDRGCTRLILLHDLDANNLQKLRSELAKSLQGCPIALSIVVIPVREIEAWLLADEGAIKRALNLKVTLKRVANPESVADPKKKLERDVYQRSGHRVTYINTRHNGQIAAECSIKNLRRCASFLPLDQFIQAHVA